MGFRSGSLALGLLLAAGAAQAQAQTPASAPLMADVFQDHAVLQRGGPVPVWGRARPGATVSVTLGEQSVRTTVGADGRWRADVTPPAAGGPYVLTAQSGDQTQTLTDILIGDVWLCSGQSNMEFGLRQVTNAETEVANSADPQMRLLLVGRRNLSRVDETALPADSVWRLSGPASTPNFGAACYFMGQELRRTQQVPIGLISASWGGSIIEDWLSEAALRRAGDYDEALQILAAHAASPESGVAFWDRVSEQWWRENEPGLKETIPWTDARFDDSGWTLAKPAGFWETDGPVLGNYDGTGWYRTSVQLTRAQARGDAHIVLGPIDDMDVVFVNGHRLGGMQGWDTPRDYVIPAGLLRPGRNLIAVGVLDLGGGGGMWGPAEDKRIELADGSTVSLAEPWRFHTSAAMSTLPGPPRAPWIGGSGTTTLYNGMIAGLGPYALTGFAWYQGESNVGDPVGYTRLLTGLMADWRARFEAPDAPFLVVQLANFGPAWSEPHASSWAELRDVQRQVVEADPRAGIAVAIDIGDRYDIHPTNKREVGRRLSLEARRLAGDTTVARSPSPVSAVREGDRIRIDFAHAGTGLVTLSADDAIGFEVCDQDKTCRFTPGTVQGATVWLTAPQAAFVRFCWADSPVCNLYGPDNLPAVPFELPVS
ncbi:sialate O-acetylesterase [Brevundimonas sp. FT23028]|uniref:sialate O-acetylesterase n=1 Tax=Brevundimonas sp. FT23028 TaxID=3393748 RepID=UPI003B589406